MATTKKEQPKKEGSPPSFRGRNELVMTNGMKVTINAAVWINKDIHGNKYLTINVGGVRINCFRYEQKEKVEEEDVV